MLPQKHRIKTDKEFFYIFKNSKKIETKDFKIYICLNIIANEQNLKSMYDKDGNFIDKLPNRTKVIKSSGKLGIIISAKQGKAHDRNLLKRRVRYILSKTILTNNSHIVVQSKTKVKDISYESIKEQLNQILEK